MQSSSKFSQTTGCSSTFFACGLISYDSGAACDTRTRTGGSIAVRARGSTG